MTGGIYSGWLGIMVCCWLSAGSSEETVSEDTGSETWPSVSEEGAEEPSGRAA